MVDNQQLSFLETIEAPTAILTPSQIFELMDERLLRQLGEDRRLERKSPRCGEALLGEYVSMWANTAPDGGVIVVGMNDQGTFEGLASVGTAKLNKL